MTVVRPRLAPVGETMFSPRAAFFGVRLGPRAAQVAARAEEGESGNLLVSPAGGILRMSPVAPSPAHRPKVGP
jgi:hypothetical protein